MPRLTEGDIEEMFTYHGPSDTQVESLRLVRDHAKYLALVINQHVPDSPDKSVAIRKLRESVMSANAAIVLEGRF